MVVDDLDLNFFLSDADHGGETDRTTQVYLFCAGDEAEDPEEGTPDTTPGIFSKLRGNQGYKHKETGETWRKDMLHKDHWDVSDEKGRKVKEVDFQGRQIWPGGPKNKNKRVR